MQPSDVKIEHKEHGKVDEMGNAEKAMCLHLGGLQADGAGLGDGSLGFLAPRFTLGSHQAEVCEIPSPILCKAICLQHMECTSVPPLRAQSLAVELTPTSPDAGGFACCRGRRFAPRLTPAQATEIPTALSPEGSSCCTYFLQSRVTEYKVQRQCSVWCDTPDEAFKTRTQHWQAVRINGNLKNLTENMLCRISAYSAQLLKISFIPLPYRVLCPQCDVKSAYI